ncbi:MAG: hypothetical protein ACMUIP_00330 [bacterium]
MIQTDSESIKMWIAVFVLSCTAFLMFFRLGHYALWDDEADTALFALSVWRTGDTYAMLDHNLIAHTYGMELKGLRNRYIPPLPFYLAAPFIGLAGQGTTFWARFPFALFGWLTVAVMLWWLWKAKASVKIWLLMSAGILGNVSLMLYARQCRYYSVSIFATTCIAFFYFHRDGRLRTNLSIMVSSLALLASHYMFYVAVYTCLLVDYCLWGRTERPFRKSDLAVIFIPQFVLGGWLVSVYNLLGKKAVGYHGFGQWSANRLNMLYLYFREMNSCEHGIAILIVLAPLLYLIFRDRRLLRGSMAVFVFLGSIALLSYKPVPGYQRAVVRYLAPVIPACLFVAVVFIDTVTFRLQWLAVPLAMLAFGTNVLHGGPLTKGDKKAPFSKIIAEGRFRSTIAEFIGELMNPPPSAYCQTARWIHKNIKEKQSVVVLPSYATYPLMYHAPHPLYAWQLKKKYPQFQSLPDVHFYGYTPPQFIIAFGPYIKEAKWWLKNLKAKGIYYDRAQILDIYWYDLIRPELFWHAFKEIRNYSAKDQAIYIFKRKNK